MAAVLVAFLMLLCGGGVIYLAVRHNRYLSSYNEAGSLMFFLFGRTGLRVFWVLFGCILLVGAVLILARAAEIV